MSLALTSRGRTIAYVMFLVALLGVLDATFLTVEHVRGVIPPCTGSSNCEAVLTSAYATVLGIPIALFGALYYAAAAVLAFAVYRYAHLLARMLLRILVGTGFVITLALVGIQAFILDAFCMYCLISAAITTTLAGLSLGLSTQEDLPSESPN